jgi:tRNA(Arg) A34 adenosine deaminase TadA
MDGILTIAPPGWLTDAVGEEAVFAEAEQRMAFVIDLARRNVAAGTGGPFAAAVFEIGSGRLVAASVNCVVAARCAIAHAEVLALGLAQQRLGCFDLGAADQPAHELVTSCEPCLMCLGAALWSGVRRVVYAARDEDARRIGFDEGPKNAAWRDEFEARGIAVVGDVLRETAVAVMLDYRNTGGRIYNARQGG